VNAVVALPLSSGKLVVSELCRFGYVCGEKSKCGRGAVLVGMPHWCVMREARVCAQLPRAIKQGYYGAGNVILVPCINPSLFCVSDDSYRVLGCVFFLVCYRLYI
jgi:hypothetical protein